MDHCVLCAVDEIYSSHAIHCTKGTALIREWMWPGGQADAGKVRAQTLVSRHGGEWHRILLAIRNAAQERTHRASSLLHLPQCIAAMRNAVESIERTDARQDDQLAAIQCWHAQVPFACGATLLVGMFCGMEIQGCRDSPSETSPAPAPATVQPAPTLQQDKSGSSGGNAQKQHHFQHDAKPDAGQGR